MAIGMGNLLDAFVENGLTNHVKGGILHMSRPPQAVEVESEADLEALGELPAGSIAYTSEYAHMWQLTGSGTWAATEEKGGSGGGGGAMVLTLTKTEGTTSDLYSLNKTWSEIKAALESGINVVMYGEGTGSYAGGYFKFEVTGVMSEDGIYGVSDYTFAYPTGILGYCEVVLGEGAQTPLFMTSSADTYPSVYVTK